MVKRSVTAFLCLIITGYCFSQETRGKNEIGIQVGGMYYMGDLTPDFGGSLKTGKPAFGIYYNRNLNSYFSLRANLVTGHLMGDDSMYASPAYKRKRNFRFNTPVTELSVLGQFDVFGTNGTIPPTKISPYLFAGVGVSFLNIQRDWSRIDTNMIHTGSSTLAGLTKDKNTELPKRLLIIPVGAGIKYHAWPRIALTAEANYRVTFTDYLDGFSYAANPQKNDSYYSFTLGAVYNFGPGSGGTNGYNFGGGKRKGGIACPKVF